ILLSQSHRGRTSKPYTASSSSPLRHDRARRVLEGRLDQRQGFRSSTKHVSS
ncbi:hypothetical protein HYDPIDRAFT_108539, partial [Hydnomerulius pinastri MD-312]